jgi:hypothetical protein
MCNFLEYKGEDLSSQAPVNVKHQEYMRRKQTGGKGGS